MFEMSALFGRNRLVWVAFSNVKGSAVMNYFSQTRSTTVATNLSLLHTDHLFLGKAIFCYSSYFFAYLIEFKIMPVSITYSMITGLAILIVLGVTNAQLRKKFYTSMPSNAAAISLRVFLIEGIDI